MSLPICLQTARRGQAPFWRNRPPVLGMVCGTRQGSVWTPSLPPSWRARPASCANDDQTDTSARSVDTVIARFQTLTGAPCRIRTYDPQLRSAGGFPMISMGGWHNRPLWLARGGWTGLDLPTTFHRGSYVRTVTKPISPGGQGGAGRGPEGARRPLLSCDRRRPLNVLELASRRCRRPSRCFAPCWPAGRGVVRDGKLGRTGAGPKSRPCGVRQPTGGPVAPDAPRHVILLMADDHHCRGTLGLTGAIHLSKMSLCEPRGRRSLESPDVINRQRTHSQSEFVRICCAKRLAEIAHTTGWCSVRAAAAERDRRGCDAAAVASRGGATASAMIGSGGGAGGGRAGRQSFSDVPTPPDRFRLPAWGGTGGDPEPGEQCMTCCGDYLPCWSNLGESLVPIYRKSLVSSGTPCGELSHISGFGTAPSESGRPAADSAFSIGLTPSKSEPVTQMPGTVY